MRVCVATRSRATCICRATCFLPRTQATRKQLPSASVAAGAVVEASGVMALAPEPKEKAPKVGAGAAEFTENEKAGAVPEVGLSILAVEELKLKAEPELDDVVAVALTALELPNENAFVISFGRSFSLLTPRVGSGMACSVVFTAWSPYFLLMSSR